MTLPVFKVKWADAPDDASEKVQARVMKKLYADLKRDGFVCVGTDDAERFVYERRRAPKRSRTRRPQERTVLPEWGDY